MSKISEYLNKRGFTFVSSRTTDAGTEISYRTPHGSVVSQKIALQYARQDEKAAKAAARMAAKPDDLCLDCDLDPCACPGPDIDDTVHSCPNCDEPQQFRGLCSSCIEDMRQTPEHPYWQNLAEAGLL